MSAGKKQPSDSSGTESLSFEEALAELESIVAEIDREGVDLDVAIKAYERGVELRKLCEKKLTEAREKISQIELDPDGKPGLVQDPDDGVPF